VGCVCVLLICGMQKDAPLHRAIVKELWVVVRVGESHTFIRRYRVYRGIRCF